MTLFFVCGVCAYAQDPWSNSTMRLMTFFTTTFARAAGLICTVIAGVTIATGAHHGKEALVALVAGISIAVGAANFYAWLFA
ncbi:MAG: hypothetical protein NVS1B14_12400 [Vulcanimicrobiaceae bacterium]